MRWLLLVLLFIPEFAQAKFITRNEGYCIHDVQSCDEYSFPCEARGYDPVCIGNICTTGQRCTTWEECQEVNISDGCRTLTVTYKCIRGECEVYNYRLK